MTATKTVGPKDAARPVIAKPKNPARDKALKDALGVVNANLARIDAAAGHNEQGGHPAHPAQPARPQKDQQQRDQHQHVADPKPGQDAGRKTARAPGSAGQRRKNAAQPPAQPPAKPAKQSKPANEAKPVKEAKPAKEPKARKLSCLDAAALVIGKHPIGCKDLIAEMGQRGLWKSPGGKTPDASLYAAIIREIAAKKAAARFKKVDRGLFVANTPGR